MLPDEVRKAVKELDAAHDDRYAPWRDQWQTIRAHLLTREAEVERLNAAWDSSFKQAMLNGQSAQEQRARAERAEALLRECLTVMELHPATHARITAHLFGEQPMSYCRWSSDDYQCDVYVYDDVGGGFTTHVAGGRYVFAEPLPEAVPFDSKDMPAYVRKMVERGRVVSAILEKSSTVAIDLPHAGESFNDPTPEACADRLESLRAIGYVVPQYAIDALREEAKDPTHD